MRAAIGEIVALAIAPWLLLSLRRLALNGGVGRTALAALLLAALVLSHNLSALLFAGLATVWCAAQVVERRRWQVLAWLAAALLVGLALSVFFWVPSLADLGLVGGAQKLTRGGHGYADHFVTGAPIVGEAWGYGVSVAGGGDGMPLQAGRLHLLLLSCGLVALWLRRRQRLVVPAAMALCALGSLVLVHQISAPLLNHLPWMPMFQLPWRWYLLFALASALVASEVAALALVRLPDALGRAVAVALVVAPGVYYGAFVRAPLLLVDTQQQLSASFDPANASAMAQLPHMASLDAYLTPERIRTLRTGTTIASECLPRGDSAPITVQPIPAYEPRAPALIVLEAEEGALTARYRIAAAAPSPAVVHRYFFPGWHATLDGDALPVAAEPSSGLIALQVPAGEHTLELGFELTPLRATCDAISLAAAGGIFFVTLARRLRARRKTVPAVTHEQQPLAGAAIRQVPDGVVDSGAPPAGGTTSAG